VDSLISKLPAPLFFRRGPQSHSKGARTFSRWLSDVLRALRNSQCAVNAVGSSALLSGDTLTLNVTFKALFTGNRILYVGGRDIAAGNNTDWQAMGTWAVP